jgi:hypothetical protein
MNYEYLKPVLDSLLKKYLSVDYPEWVKLYKNSDRFSDYCEGIDDPGISAMDFWQAHTDVLELESDDSGSYALVSITVYPFNVHRSPPAPSASLVIYSSGKKIVSDVQW